MKLIFFFPFVLTYLSTFGQNPLLAGVGENEPEVTKEAGIKREIIYQYSEKGKKIDSSLREIRLYDTVGRLKEVDSYHNMNLQMRNAYLYDQQDKLYKILPTYSSFTRYSIEFDYDSLGRPYRTYEYNEDTSHISVKNKKYNEKNLLSELWVKMQDDEFYLSRKYYYDERSRLSKIEEYDKKGFYQSTTIKYNVEETLCSFVVEHETTVYVTEEVHFDSHHRVDQIVYYPNPDDIMSRLFFYYGKPNTTTYVYNDDGSLKEYIFTRGDGQRKYAKHFYNYW